MTPTQISNCTETLIQTSDFGINNECAVNERGCRDCTSDAPPVNRHHVGLHTSGAQRHLTATGMAALALTECVSGQRWRDELCERELQRDSYRTGLVTGWTRPMCSQRAPFDFSRTLWCVTRLCYAKHVVSLIVTLQVFLISSMIKGVYCVGLYEVVHL